jgi:multiple antibiotic resistance protein
MLGREFSLFLETFTTLLAIINPLEVLPVYLALLAGQDAAAHRAVARKACLYALGLSYFFLVFGTLILRLFGVPLAMVRVAGGLILIRIGFSLFMPENSGGELGRSSAGPGANIAFVPLAMPLMFGPGAIATIVGMASTIRDWPENIPATIAVCLAIFATMYATFLCLAHAERLTKLIGPLGIDAVTRIVGFFVSAIGVGLVFDGVIEGLTLHGVAGLH